jgi:hypothetical protein
MPAIYCCGERMIDEGTLKSLGENMMEAVKPG